MRIGAQLVGREDGVQRWEQSYDRAPGDEIKIQTDIATNVAQSLSITLGQAANAALRLAEQRTAPLRTSTSVHRRSTETIPARKRCAKA